MIESESQNYRNINNLSLCFFIHSQDAIGEIKNRDWEINAMGERFSEAMRERGKGTIGRRGTRRRRKAKK